MISHFRDKRETLYGLVADLDFPCTDGTNRKYVPVSPGASSSADSPLPPLSTDASSRPYDVSVHEFTGG